MTRASTPLPLVIRELRDTLDRLTTQVNSTTLSARRRKELEGQIREVIDELAGFLNSLDPIRQPTAVFDPSNPKIVGRFVALAVVAQQRHPLSAIPRFYGSGVYAIYYDGPFEPYASLAGTETPIYVGQAAPAINNARTPLEQGAKLCGRLAEHGRNIAKAVSTLDIAHFEFRSLVVQSGWETAAEDYLIHLFRPIWNNETRLVYGIGKHGDAAATRGNKRSPWDTLHPARQWATTPDAKSVETITAELQSHFIAHPTFPTLESVLANFIDELSQV